MLFNHGNVFLAFCCCLFLRGRTGFELCLQRGWAITAQYLHPWYLPLTYWSQTSLMHQLASSSGYASWLGMSEWAHVKCCSSPLPAKGNQSDSQCTEGMEPATGSSGGFNFDHQCAWKPQQEVCWSKAEWGRRGRHCPAVMPRVAQGGLSNLIRSCERI